MTKRTLVLKKAQVNKAAEATNASTSSKLQKMSVFGHLPDQSGNMKNFKIGDIIHDVKLPDVSDPTKTRKVSIFRYSEEYRALNGPAISITNHNVPPTVRNQKNDFIILEGGKLPTVLANAIPRGKNADIFSAFPGMQDFKKNKTDLDRLNDLCKIGGASIGSIEILGNESRHSPNSLSMLPLNNYMLNLVTQIDVDSIDSKSIDTLNEMGFDKSQLCVNITGRETSFSVVAKDDFSEKVYNVKLPSGTAAVAKKDEAYISSVLCNAAQTAGVSESYISKVHENKQTGVAAQVTEYAYSDFLKDEDGHVKSSNSLPMFSFPLTDFLSEEDRKNPTYAAIADTMDRMMINSDEAKASLARSMLFNHAVHATSFNIGDIRCVVKSIEPDPGTGLHFEMVPLSFGLVADPVASNSMQIALQNGFYNGKSNHAHEGMLPMHDQGLCASIVAKELGISMEDSIAVYNDVKRGILSLPDHAADHEMTKEQFKTIANAVSFSFGEDIKYILLNDYDLRLEAANQLNAANDADRDNTAVLKRTR